MTAITTIRTARKVHECSWCGEDIRPGERYEEWADPPGDAFIGNTGWLHDASHLGAYAPGRLGFACDEAAAYRERAQREGEA